MISPPRYRSKPSPPKDMSSSSGSPTWFKDRTRLPNSYTLGQIVAVAALCSSFAAVTTALMSVYFFSNSLIDVYATASRTSTTMQHRLQEPEQQRLRRPNSEPKEIDPLKSILDDTIAISPQPSTEDSSHPKVAWLMSFPNSGTSFTIHMTREASNCTTATNYALEGEIKDKPSVAAIQGPDGKNGPWLELIPDRYTTIPSTILTKTHCKGFCTGRYCGPDKTVHTVRSFMKGCLSGTRAVEKNGRLEKIDVTYDASLVSKAIHIFRHPLDNIVARFHLEYNVQKARGNDKYVKVFPKNAEGFKRWCDLEDENKDLLSSRFVDSALRNALSKIPCFNEFYRYVQWHNLAFSMSHDMNLPTMILHYHEYSTDFESARDRVLKFLELPRVGQGIEFDDGKVYRSYYSLEQKQAIRSFLKEFASFETWNQLKDYDFETNDSLTSTS